VASVAPGQPAFALRLVDSGGVGIPIDDWGGTYSHDRRTFRDVIVEQAPYIEPAAFDRVEREWRNYVERMIEYGNNAVAVPLFLELVDFDRIRPVSRATALFIRLKRLTSPPRGRASTLWPAVRVGARTRHAGVSRHRHAGADPAPLNAAAAHCSDRDPTRHRHAESGGLGRLSCYNTVLGDIESPSLVVSTKFTAGDFFSYLPLNPTLTS
jgi:hypothetical protein